MILPTIHSNGTGAQTLYDDYERARTALNDAETALGAVEFNARDYYVQGPEVWTAARNERRQWYAQLEAMEAHFLAIASLAMENIGAKNARMAK